MRVRPGRMEDLVAVMDLVRHVLPLMQASGNHQWDKEYPDDTVFERDVEHGQMWVAQIEEQIAGVAAITTEQAPEYADVGWDTAELAVVVHRLAVDPKFRGRGIAAALMVQAEVVASERQIPVLRVDTNVQNEAAQRLFLKLNHVLAGEIGLSFRPGLRVRCYEKRLS